MNHLTDALTVVTQAVVPVHTPKQAMICGPYPIAHNGCGLKADLCSISDIT
jgi:hypothetical protein